MTREDLAEEVFRAAEKRPLYIRFGQFVFNYLHRQFPVVVEKVQFEDMVDCFYRDDMVEEFIDKVYERCNDYVKNS